MATITCLPNYQQQKENTNPLKSPTIHFVFQFVQILCISPFSLHFLCCCSIVFRHSKFELIFLAESWSQSLTPGGKGMKVSIFLVKKSQQSDILRDVILMPRKIYIAIRNANDCVELAFKSKYFSLIRRDYHYFCSSSFCSPKSINKRKNSKVLGGFKTSFFFLRKIEKNCTGSQY